MGFSQRSPFPFAHVVLSASEACAEPKTKAPVVAHSKADVSFHANQPSTINSVLWKDLPGGYVTYHDLP